MGPTRSSTGRSPARGTPISSSIRWKSLSSTRERRLGVEPPPAGLGVGTRRPDIVGRKPDDALEVAGIEIGPKGGEQAHRAGHERGRERFATDALGYVYVADQSNSRIQKFTGNGAYVAQWGSLGGTGTGPFFNNPVGMAIDVGGNLFIADQQNFRIVKYGNAPAVALVSDVRNDQGSQVRLRVLRASADVSGSGAAVTHYDVFRRIDPLPVPAAGAGVSC